MAWTVMLSNFSEHLLWKLGMGGSKKREIVTFIKSVQNQDLKHEHKELQQKKRKGEVNTGDYQRYYKL